jgi:flagellar basal-body rod protein FlgF
MTGLNATLDRMTASTNNLANANTTAFKAQQPVFQAQPFYRTGLADRVDVATAEDTADLKPVRSNRPGAPRCRGQGIGLDRVQASDGGVALTRNGSLSISPSGVLQTSDGNPVLGRGGAPITLPPLQTVTIGEDGTISGALVGQTPDQVAAINRILLTNPPAATLKRRADGLFRISWRRAAADASVQLQVGALEGSNANPVATMMSMIENTRMFQMQTELVQLV